jgi:NAD(P)-dependent dehydrogenase (short-subunit alcohol dehydrogenase family)
MSQTVLVTGASSGIGAAVAHLFHLRGFTVFGTTRAAHPVSPREFQMLSLDVNSDASVQACVDQVSTQTGRLDILVNNAGYVLTGAAEETSIAEAKAQFETNFFGVARMVNAVLMREEKARAGLSTLDRLLA